VATARWPRRASVKVGDRLEEGSRSPCPEAVILVFGKVAESRQCPAKPLPLVASAWAANLPKRSNGDVVWRRPSYATIPSDDRPTRSTAAPTPMARVVSRQDNDAAAGVRSDRRARRKARAELAGADLPKHASMRVTSAGERSEATPGKMVSSNMPTGLPEVQVLRCGSALSARDSAQRADLSRAMARLGRFRPRRAP